MAEIATVQQSSEQKPAQPAYVLRGHNAQIHAVLFLMENLRLLSGDAEGWVVLWSLESKRAVAVWHAHKKSVIGFGSWNVDKIVTHGRDNMLHVWQVRPEDEEGLSTLLPIDQQEPAPKWPLPLYSLDVNALNFCSFAMCQDRRQESASLESDSILISTPGVQDGHINITSLPASSRVATIPPPKDLNTGMVMALGLSFLASEKGNGRLTPPLLVFAGYESGHACVWQEVTTSSSSVVGSAALLGSAIPYTNWKLIYTHNAHTQPILSLCFSSDQNAFYTSSADAIIARHRISPSGARKSAKPHLPSRAVQTKHAGQQALQIRSDDRIFATAGWDGRARVYSTRTMKELAVLKWHTEGCYALAFAELRRSDPTQESGTVEVRGNSSVAARRTEAAQNTHWLALGSKDGKVSLWDIF